MRLSILILTISSLAGVQLFAAGDNSSTALRAIKLLPRGEAKKIARIEARDGTPEPERWHIIVHDPKEETGIHEYVVAGGEVVASRAISQFADGLKEQDVVGSSAVRIDSDRLAKLAQEYAFANNVTIASMNYALKKEGAEAAPLWSVSCLDDKGKDIGRLVVSAGKGNVVSHEGFELEPKYEPQEKPRTHTSSQVASRSDREQRRVTPYRARPTTPAPEKKDVFSRIGKFFTGQQ